MNLERTQNSNGAYPSRFIVHCACTSLNTFKNFFACIPVVIGGFSSIIPTTLPSCPLLPPSPYIPTSSKISSHSSHHSRFKLNALTTCPAPTHTPAAPGRSTGVVLPAKRLTTPAT